MSELELQPGEEILDKRGGDFGGGVMMTAGYCILTNRRLIVCSISRPRDNNLSAIAGAGAKAFGPAAEMAAIGVNLVLALKSNKPLYPVFEQPFENLISIVPYRWGLGCGVKVQTPEVQKFCIKLGLGRTRDKWVSILKNVIQSNCPHVAIKETAGGLTFSRRTAQPPPPRPIAEQPQPPRPTGPGQVPGRQNKNEAITFVVCRGEKKSTPLTLETLLKQLRQGKLQPDDIIISNQGGDAFPARSLIENVAK